MAVEFHVIDDITKEIEMPTNGILSKTLYKGSDAKMVLFCFAASEELSEHTASRPAILHILQGEAQITLGDEQVTAAPGTWIYMAPHLRHSVVARTPLAFLLYLLAQS